MGFLVFLGISRDFLWDLLMDVLRDFLREFFDFFRGLFLGFLGFAGCQNSFSPMVSDPLL